PNSVCRFRQDDHSSGPRITARLKRPPRRLWRTEPARFPGEARRLARTSLPIWSCSVWGLPCPPHYCGGGAPFPHLFSLSLAFRPGRYVFCGTFRRTVPPIKARVPSRMLYGTLLCGVRTFLPSCDERPSGPAANSFIIVQAESAGRKGNLSLTPVLWVRARADKLAGPRRSTTESARRDKPAHRARVHAEAP